MTASASVIRASARRMALPTATRARSGWSGKALVRPPNPAALESWATSQSRSALTWRARGGRLRPGRVDLAVRRVGVAGRGAPRVRLGQPLPGRHQRGPVRQREVVLDGRGQVLDGQVELPRGERGDAESVPHRAEAGD